MCEWHSAFADVTNIVVRIKGVMLWIIGWNFPV